MAKIKKVPAYQLFIAQGFFKTKDEALPWVMSGQAFHGNLKITSLSQMLPADGEIIIKGYDLPYTSKGGLKLEKAICDFNIDVKNRVCIDAGASTGGFTDCLVKHGASLVYAVDVGYGQLHGGLRQSPHVVNLERTNISDEKLLSLSPKPDLASVDLSYLSLRKGVPAFARVMDNRGEMMCLVKPLFEVDDADARRTGQISPDAYELVLTQLIDDLNSMPSVQVANVTYSPVTGNGGTHEFFLHVLLGQDKALHNLTIQVQSAIKQVLALTAFRK